MFGYDLRLIVAGVTLLATFAAADVRSQAVKPQELHSTSDPQARTRALENELIGLRRLVGKYQTQLANIFVDDLRASEFARLVAGEETARNELTRVEELYEAARKELEVAVNDRIDLQAQVARLAKRMEDEPGERAALQKEREQLTTQLVVLTEELKRERARQDVEIEGARQAAVTLDEKLRQARVENERLRGRYLEATESLVTLQENFRLMSADAESARQQLRLAREREVKLGEQLAAVRDDRAAAVEKTELLAALEAAQSAGREQTDEIVRLRAELGGVSKERDELASEIKAARAEKAALQQRAVETKRSLDEMRGQIEETRAVREELEKLQQQKQQFEIALRTLQDQSGERGKLVVALEKSNAARMQQEQEMGRLRGELESAVSARKQLESALEVAGDTQKSLRSRQERVDTALADVRTRLHQTLTESATTKQQLAAAQQESATLKQQVAELEAQNEQSRTELAKSVERLNTLDEQRLKDAERLELALAKADGEKGTLDGILKERTAELEDARKMLASAQAELQAASTRSGQQAQEIERLKVAWTTATREKESLAQTMEKWDAQRQEGNDTLAVLQRKLDAVSGELEQSAQKIESLEVALERANKEKGTLTAELKRLETQAEQTNAAMVQVQERSRELSEMSALVDQLNKEKEAAAEKLKGLSAERQSVAEAITKSYQQAVEELAPEIEQRAITVIQGPDRMTIRVGGAALFSSGQSSLRPESRAMLDKVVGLLKEFPDYDVRAEGHTDSTGNWSSNWELSASRAGAVVRYLQEKGIKPERLASTGYAFYRPVAPNDTPEGRAANRRIEITLEPKE